MAQLRENRILPPSDDKLALIATIEIKGAERDRVLRALLAHRDRCLRDEPGTLRFEVLLPRETNSQLFSIEVYENDSAFDAHLHSPSIAQFRNETDGAIGSLSVTRCTPQSNCRNSCASLQVARSRQKRRVDPKHGEETQIRQSVPEISAS